MLQKSGFCMLLSPLGAKDRRPSSKSPWPVRSEEQYFTLTILSGLQSQLELHLFSGTAELPCRHSLGPVSPGVNTNTAVVLNLERATIINFLETSDSSHLRSQQLGPVVETYSNVGVVRAQRILPHLNVSEAQTVCLYILALETWATQKESIVGK